MAGKKVNYRLYNCRSTHTDYHLTSALRFDGQVTSAMAKYFFALSPESFRNLRQQNGNKTHSEFSETMHAEELATIRFGPSPITVDFQSLFQISEDSAIFSNSDLGLRAIETALRRTEINGLYPFIFDVLPGIVNILKPYFSECLSEVLQIVAWIKLPVPFGYDPGVPFAEPLNDRFFWPKIMHDLKDAISSQVINSKKAMSNIFSDDGFIVGNSLATKKFNSNGDTFTIGVQTDYPFKFGLVKDLELQTFSDNDGSNGLHKINSDLEIKIRPFLITPKKLFDTITYRMCARVFSLNFFTKGSNSAPQITFPGSTFLDVLEQTYDLKLDISRRILPGSHLRRMKSNVSGNKRIFVPLIAIRQCFQSAFSHLSLPDAFNWLREKNLAPKIIHREYLKSFFLRKAIPLHKDVFGHFVVCRHGLENYARKMELETKEKTKLLLSIGINEDVPIFKTLIERKLSTIIRLVENLKVYGGTEPSIRFYLTNHVLKITSFGLISKALAIRLSALIDLPSLEASLVQLKGTQCIPLDFTIKSLDLASPRAVHYIKSLSFLHDNGACFVTLDVFRRLEKQRDAYFTINEATALLKVKGIIPKNRKDANCEAYFRKNGVMEKVFEVNMVSKRLLDSFLEKISLKEKVLKREKNEKESLLATMGIKNASPLFCSLIKMPMKRFKSFTKMLEESNLSESVLAKISMVNASKFEKKVFLSRIVALQKEETLVDFGIKPGTPYFKSLFRMPARRFDSLIKLLRSSSLSDRAIQMLEQRKMSDFRRKGFQNYLDELKKIN